MHDYDNIVRERQKAIRREINRRQLSIKAIYLDGEWENASTVLSYFPAKQEVEPATMSIASFYRLFKSLPTELLSIMLPDGYAITRVPEGIDHDDIERACREFLTAKGEAHHPESPAGRDIAECERETLNVKVVQLRGKVRA